MTNLKECLYSVKGMHCASCEILVEKKLLDMPGVKSVEASTAKGTVLIEYEGDKPLIHSLNKIFKEEGYTFSEEVFKQEKSGFFGSLITAVVIIGAFLLLNQLGLVSILSVNSQSSLILFFLLGILAGVSSCAALIGGIILSMSKQWLSIYSADSPTSKKMQPHIMFNFGRVLSFAVFGALLGLLGSKLQISATFTAWLVIAISILMFLIAMQMLGVKKFQRFQIGLPKFITRNIADESNFKGKNMPLLMGVLTFFLPCGFTITAQSIALISGNPLQGALIMALFALGTAPALLGIGLSGVLLSKKPSLAKKFSRTAGVLILFFALFNANSQLNVLGYTSLSDVNIRPQTSTNVDVSGLAPIVEGKQLLKMDASSRGYNPNYFKIKVGIPVRWEITDTGTSGCTNAVISQSLFQGSIPLTPGQVSVKEFTPTKAGKYKFSCWMGMVSGIIEVIDVKNPSSNLDTASADPISSGANGCGCGGGGGSSCKINTN